MAAHPRQEMRGGKVTGYLDVWKINNFMAFLYKKHDGSGGDRKCWV